MVVRSAPPGRMAQGLAPHATPILPPLAIPTLVAGSTSCRPVKPAATGEGGGGGRICVVAWADDPLRDRVSLVCGRELTQVGRLRLARLARQVEFVLVVDPAGSDHSVEAVETVQDVRVLV